jgi:hypothetical protein
VRIPQLLLITAFVVALGPARSADPVQGAEAANWTKIGGTDHFALLINPPSIEQAKIGKGKNKIPVLKAWVMYDFIEPTTNAAGTFRSAKILEYFKCSNNTSSQKSLVFYSDAMGDGNVVKAVTHLDREMHFAPLVPGSADAEVGHVVCHDPADAKG